MKTTMLNPLSLAHHLRVAAAQYDRDAALARETFSTPATPEQKEGGERLARSFDDQATQARSWADALENFEDDIDLTYAD